MATKKKTDNIKPSPAVPQDMVPSGPAPLSTKQAAMAKQEKDNDSMRKLSNSVRSSIPSFKKGGKVKKTGLARVHRGELVLTAQEAKGRTKSKKKSTRKKYSKRINTNK